MLVKVAPPLVESCHCSVGSGSPVATAPRVTVVPLSMVWFSGCSDRVSGAVTVRVTGVVVTDPATLVRVASYSLPLLGVVGVKA